MTHIIGWDIGGANVKAGRVALFSNEPARVLSQPFEIWRDKDRLPEVLIDVCSRIASSIQPQTMAVTMTAELSDIFAAKREGVLFVLESIERCFPQASSYVLSIFGKFVPLPDAKARPLDFAATNWLATAMWLSQRIQDCLLVDVGSTTTDIVPIVGGQVCAKGRTDMERLASGELVFTGALRTNVAAIVKELPVTERFCRVASEYFAVSGDVHLILGHLGSEEYTCTTPDGRAPTMDSARQRLARVVCADTEMISAAEIDGMARYIHAQQISQIGEALHQVIDSSPRFISLPVIPMGIGAFLGAEAAESLGLEILNAESILNRNELKVAPCLAAAYLLAEYMREGNPCLSTRF